MSKTRRGSRRKPKPFSTSNRLNHRTFALRFFKAIGTPKALAAHMLLEANEFDQLIELTCQPLDYTHQVDFFLDYQVVSLLKKFPNFKLANDPSVSALESFLSAESNCRKTNIRLQQKRTSYLKTASPVASVLHRAQRKISSILGPVPTLDKLNMAFGPGASYGVRGETSVYDKLLSEAECTFAMLEILEPFVREVPAWFPYGEHKITLREGSELMFVPKNAKTHRVICIEPMLNGFIQKGLGSWIGGRLKNFGIDLTDQTQNQRLASVAHEESLCTVDFKSASDTISYQLVLDLLPFDWFEILDVTRCPAFKLKADKTWYEFNKFSSMGNAYTFELESLIFYSLAWACVEQVQIKPVTGKNLSVYGDDVIIPRAAFDLFQEVCQFCGFSINTEKTFTSGPFYESCGQDWYLGHLVRPFFLKGEIKVAEDAFYVTNQTLETMGRILELAREDRPSAFSVCDRLSDVHAWLVSCIPRRLRHLVPKGSGDGGLVADFSLAVPRPAPEQWCGYSYRSVRTIPQMKEPDPEVTPMGYALYFAGKATSQVGIKPGLHSFKNVPRASDNGLGYAVRGRTRTVVLDQVWFDPWPSTTPWGDRSIALLKDRR